MDVSEKKERFLDALMELEETECKPPVNCNGDINCQGCVFDSGEKCMAELIRDNIRRSKSV